MTKLLIFVFSALLIPVSPAAWAQETAARDRERFASTDLHTWGRQHSGGHAGD